MRRHLGTTLAALLTVIGLAVAGPVSAASAQTSGPESSTGFLIATGVSGERGKDAIKYAQSAPAHETVVDRRWWPVFGWTIAPAAPAFDHM